MDTMQKHIAHSKTLVQDNNFLVEKNMIQLSIEVQIALHTCQIFQENWDKILSLILKVHAKFLSHFGVTM